TTRDDGTSLKLSSHVAYPGRLLDAFESLNLLEGITGLAAKTKQVVVLDTDNYPSYLPYRSLFEAEKIHSNAFVPLLSKGNVVGILHVGRKRPSLRTESDLRFLNSVASQLGVAIENAQLYQKMKQSEERYRSVLESISDVVYKASSEGVMVFMSPNIDRLVGYRPSDFYQRKGLWLSLIHPDDRKSVDALAGQSFGEGLHRSIEYRVLPRGKAEYIWIRDSMSATKDSNGKVIEVYGIISAITERKKLEQEIRDSEQILRKVIDSMGDALIVTDLRGVIREVNREFERMTGSSRRETLGQEFPYKWTQEEEMARMVQWVNTLREKGYLHDFDLTMVNAKGEPVYTSLNTTLLRNEVGDPIAMLSIVRDITERKRLAEELRHRTRQIELLNRIISTANKSMNFEEIFSTITREVRELVPFDEINVSLLHPSRKSLEVYAIESNNPGATLKRGSTLPLEMSISRTAINKGKAVVVPELSRYPKSLSYHEGLRSQISIPFYSKGEVLGAFNIASKTPRAYSGWEVQVLQPIADQIGAIVDRIRLFQKVSHDATYIHNLLDSMDNVVYTVDKESRIREVNKAWKDFATRSGMPELADERTVQGKQLLETVRDRALKEIYQNIIHEMLTGQTPYVSREISHEEPGGERVYQMRVNPMLIENEITGLVFTNTDITDIKKTEAALRRRSEELLALNEIATLESTSLRLGPILGSVVPKIRQLLEADAVAVFLVGKDSGNIDLAEQEGLDEEAVRKIQRLPTQESATGLAISRGEPLLINERLAVNSPSQSMSHDLTAVREMRAFAAIPLHSKEKVLGALDVFYSKEKTFSRQDQQILLLLATQLASAIENALLYEQVSDQVKRLTVLYEL
ncbi:MAG TPA: PAS domain S-box protein, partial [Bacteroidota bacterium]